MYRFGVLVNEREEVEIVIPQMLHREVCSKFTSKMERMEFGFHFFETVEQDFPELHQLIIKEIRSQLQMGNDGVYYSLTSDLFEDETY